MILIEDILVADDVVEKQFACNLSACKGACCIEGDFGAPLLTKEVITIGQILNDVLPYLPEASKKVIQEKGFSTYNKEADTDETELMPDGACVFMGRDELGITYCGIEKAYRAGDIDYKKPISCHLYPIRVSNNRITGFKALNYDVWDICSAACTKGKKEEIRVFEFAKDALVRAFGEEFYLALKGAVASQEDK